MPYLKQHASTENFFEALVSKSNVYRPIVEFLDNIVKTASQLSWLDFQEIAVQISEENSSGFCSEIHRATKQSVIDSEPTLFLNKNLSKLIDFSIKLNSKSSSINQSDIQQLIDTGFDEKTIEEVIAWVAIIDSYNTVANGLGFSNKLPSDAFKQMGAGNVENDGFLPVFDFYTQQMKTA